jgi:hypothetical protein
MSFGGKDPRPHKIDRVKSIGHCHKTILNRTGDIESDNSIHSSTMVTWHR